MRERTWRFVTKAREPVTGTHYYAREGDALVRN
jgi:hypothetical protein